MLYRLVQRLRSVAGPDRLHRRKARLGLECLDPRIVPTSLTPSLIEVGFYGIAGGGEVWHYDSGSGWTEVGNLKGAVSLAVSKNKYGQEEVFAETADGSLWVAKILGPYSNGAGSWANTGGRLVSGTIAATDDGITGIAGGGTVWHFQDDDTGAWTQLAGLSGVVSLVHSSETYSFQDNSIFAQTADGSVWFFDSQVGTWANTGGRLVVGSMIRNPLGIAGIAGGGTVWHYQGSWNQVGDLTGATSLTWAAASATSAEDLAFAQTQDGSVWVYPTYNTQPFAPGGTWGNTGGKIAAGSMKAVYDGVIGLAGGETVWQYQYGQGWSQDVGLSGVAALSAASNTDPVSSGLPYEAFAVLPDGSVWYFNAKGKWINTGGRIT